MTQQATLTLAQDMVPLIDMAAFGDPKGRARIAQEIRAACVKTGFFLIKDHGISDETRDAAVAASKRYFGLPEEDRLIDLVDERFRRGFMPAEPGPRATVESYELSLDLPLDDPDVIAGRFLHGPNRWPDRYPWFRGAIEPYLQVILVLAEKLERLLALSLNIDEEFFVEVCRKPNFHLRLLHYFAQTEEEKQQHMATGAHSDFGFLTILMQDPNGGLELQMRDGEWITAPYVEGSFVINVGDMLELWTNELYVSTPHRVIGLTGRDRFSIPAFINASYDTVVECLPNCLAPGETPKFKPTTAGKYTEERMMEETEEDRIYESVGGHRHVD